MCTETFYFWEACFSVIPAHYPASLMLLKSDERSNDFSQNCFQYLKTKMIEFIENVVDRRRHGTH